MCKSAIPYKSPTHTQNLQHIITPKLPLRFVYEIFTHGRFELTSKTKLTGPMLQKPGIQNGFLIFSNLFTRTYRNHL